MIKGSGEYMINFLTRVLKEAMRSGGSNTTRKHMEDISLSGLFLIDVTKTIDQQFGVHHSTAHTTRDAHRNWRVT